MFLGPRITLGAFVPDDYGAMYCWANDIAAARLDGPFRPANLRDAIASCEMGNDASRVMLAIRQRTDPKIIGYINIHNVSAVHRSADLGIRIGDERNRDQGFGKEALAMALRYCWDHLNLERVGLVVFRHNARAIAAYSACGFNRSAAGELRQAAPGWCCAHACVPFRHLRAEAHRAERRHHDQVDPGSIHEQKTLENAFSQF
jgi:RimJ/RimL family protein N-acetyltransferase